MTNDAHQMTYYQLISNVIGCVAVVMLANVCTLLFVAPVSAENVKGDLAPNILWIITDDQRPDSVGAYNQAVYGHQASPLGYIESPNVDRLAAEGILFTKAYTNSPVCAPSRASLHSGRYPFRSGRFAFELSHQGPDFVDGRVEVDWSQENKYVLSEFSKGAHDGKLNIPQRLLPK